MASALRNARPGIKGTQRRAVVATTIGNALEWFDFVVFGFLAVTMAKVFFPKADDAAGLLLTFATFGVTFLLRPLGAVVMGAYADRRGRKAALTLTIALMTIGTVVIAVTPGYASIGIWAPLIVVLARACQGISAGGEFGSATAFLAEQDPERRGFFASWQFASQGATTILAAGFGMGLTTWLSPAQIESWGWRLPFAFGALIGPVAYYVRRHLAETPEFRGIIPETAPLRSLITGHIPQVLYCVGLTATATATAYTILFMPTYAIQQLGLPPSAAFLAGLLTGVIQLVVVPIIGALSDHYGRKRFAVGGALATLVLAYPMFAALVLAPATSTLFAVQLLLGLVNAIYVGALGGLMSELFPTRTRTSGLSIGNALAVTVFGGFAPFINAWLIATTQSGLAPSFYLVAVTLLSLVSLAGLARTNSTTRVE